MGLFCFDDFCYYYFGFIVYFDFYGLGIGCDVFYGYFIFWRYVVLDYYYVYCICFLCFVVRMEIMFRV